MEDRDLTLGDILRDLYRAKYTLLISVLITCLAGFLFLFLAIPKYQATMIVAPADGYALGDYASSVPYDHMLSIPFWRPPETENVSTDFYRFVHTATGPSVAEILLKDKNVLAGISRDSSWLNTADNWTAEELSAYLKDHIKVEPLGATPLRRLKYYHPESEFASALLRKIHLVSDQLIRRDRRRQSGSRIQYLQKTLAKNTHPDHRKIITNLLMQQEHIQMLANLDEPYAAIVVEPAASSPRPVWPNAYVVMSLSVILGLVIGYVISTVRRN